MGNRRLKGFSSDHTEFYPVKWEVRLLIACVSVIWKGSLGVRSWGEQWKLEMVHSWGRAAWMAPEKGCCSVMTAQVSLATFAYLYDCPCRTSIKAGLLILIKVSYLERHWVLLINIKEFSVATGNVALFQVANFAKSGWACRGRVTVCLGSGSKQVWIRASVLSFCVTLSKLFIFLCFGILVGSLSGKNEVIDRKCLKHCDY